MFEQVGGLVVDLERILVVEKIEVERVRHHRQCITTGYGCLPSDTRSIAATPRQRNEFFASGIISDVCVPDPCRTEPRNG